MDYGEQYDNCRTYKNRGGYFIIEFPSIGVITQALGEDDILPMAKDVIDTLIHGEYKFTFKVTQECNKLFLESNQKEFVRFVQDRINDVSRNNLPKTKRTP